MNTSNYKQNHKPNFNTAFKQGYYTLINHEKYIGDPMQIIYRSSWEFKFCKYCDLTEDIVKWSSEPNFPPFPIRYMNPVSQTERNYYVDFYLRLRDENNIEKDYIVEVKPNNHLRLPNPIKGNKTLKKLKSYNYLLESYLVNEAKSIAAQEFARNLGYEYMIVTEDFLK